MSGANDPKTSANSAAGSMSSSSTAMGSLSSRHYFPQQQMAGVTGDFAIAGPMASCFQQKHPVVEGREVAQWSVIWCNRRAELKIDSGRCHDARHMLPSLPGLPHIDYESFHPDEACNSGNIPLRCNLAKAQIAQPAFMVAAICP